MSPRAMAVSATMLVLPEAVDAEAVGVDRRRRAAGHHADIVGEVGLGQLAAEGVEDAGQLVDRAIAEAVAADAGAVAGAAARGQRPVGRAAPRDRAELAAAFAWRDSRIRAR